MTTPTTLDGLLVQWGDRLFYPGNRIVRSPSAVLSGGALHDRARTVRARLHATVVRGAPQVMVKVTGGGRGMAAIAAHFRYISKHGRLAIEDDRGVVARRQGGRARPGRAVAPCRRPHRRAQRASRSLQHHAVDAGRHAGICAQGCRPRLRRNRTVEPPLRDGAAHAPGQPARPPGRARRGQGWPAPQPAQGRPAALARDLRREAARARHRGRSLAADHARRQPAHRAAVATQGPGRRARPRHRARASRRRSS